MTYLQVGKRFCAEKPTTKMPAVTQEALAALSRVPEAQFPTVRMPAVRK